MRDLIGEPLAIGDTVVHVSNSSGSIYGNKGIITGVNDRGWVQLDNSEDKRTAKHPQRLIKIQGD